MKKHIFILTAALVLSMTTISVSFAKVEAISSTTKGKTNAVATTISTVSNIQENTSYDLFLNNFDSNMYSKLDIEVKVGDADIADFEIGSFELSLGRGKGIIKNVNTTYKSSLSAEK